MADARLPEHHFTLSLDPCDAQGVLVADRSCAPERHGLTIFPEKQVFDPKAGKLHVELGRRWDDGIAEGYVEFTVPRRGGYYRPVLRNDDGQVSVFAGEPTWYAERAFLGHGDPIRVAIPRTD